MADKTVGQLVVDLVGDTSGLEVSVEAVGDLLAQVGAAAAALGAAAAAGLAVAVKASLDAADALQDLSDRTGIATEQLSELQHAAEMGGGNLEGMTSALVKLSEVQALAAHGGQEQARALAALGVSVRDSSGALKPVDELLGDVAQGLSELGSASDRAAVATKLFGGAGVQLMPALIGGREGLREAAAQAREFGLVVSGETASAANAMNDNLDLLAKRAQGFANAVAEGVAPALARLSGELVSASGGIVSLRDVASGTREAFDAFISAAQRLGDQLAATVRGREAWGLWAGDIRSVGDALAAVAIAINPLLQGVQSIVVAFDVLSAKVAKGAAAWGAVFAALNQADLSQVISSMQLIREQDVKDQEALTESLFARLRAIWSRGSDDLRTESQRARDNALPAPPTPQATRSLGALASPPAAPKAEAFAPQGPQLLGAQQMEFLSQAEHDAALERVRQFFAIEIPKAIDTAKAGALRALERYEADTAKIGAEGTTTRLDDLKAAEEAELLALQQSLIGREDLLEAAGARRLAIQEKYMRLTEQAADQEAQQMIQAGTAIGGSLVDGIRGALEGKDGASAVRSILGMVSGIFSTLGSLIPGFGAIGAAVGGFAGLGARLFADGGYVSGPGGPRDDAILARLSAGEYVLDADTTARVGRHNLDAISRRSLPHFAGGGFVGGGGGGGGAMGGISLTAHVTIHGNPTPAEYARLTREALRGATDPLIRQLQAKGLIDPAWRG